jgi:hypothetical protein
MGLFFNFGVLISLIPQTPKLLACWVILSFWTINAPVEMDHIASELAPAEGAVYLQPPRPKPRPRLLQMRLYEAASGPRLRKPCMSKRKGHIVIGLNRSYESQSWDSNSKFFVFLWLRQGKLYFSNCSTHLILQSSSSLANLDNFTSPLLVASQHWP